MEERNVEVIESKDFFDVLTNIGIQIGEGDNEELKKALSFSDSQLQDKFSVKKIKNSIEQFAFNEELRKKAHQYYDALIDEEELLESKGILKEQQE